MNFKPTNTESDFKTVPMSEKKRKENQHQSIEGIGASLLQHQKLIVISYIKKFVKESQ